MPPYRPIISYDTSAINRLLNDPDSSALVSILKSRYYTRITSTNIEEIIANSNIHRRQQLRDFIKPLAATGECIQPYHWIVQRLLRLHASGEDYHWRHQDIRFVSALNFVLGDEPVSEKLSEKQRKEVGQLEDRFIGFFEGERWKFERFFKTGGTRPQTYSEMLQLIKVESGSFWALASVIYHSATGKSLSLNKAKEFLDSCPAARALVMAVCMAQFERSVRDLKTALSYRAGRFDLLCTVYLCYCDLFISADKRQCNALGAIAEAGNLRAKVVYYPDFRRRVFPFSSFTTKSLPL